MLYFWDGKGRAQQGKYQNNRRFFRASDVKSKKQKVKKCAARLIAPDSERLIFQFLLLTFYFHTFHIQLYLSATLPSRISDSHFFTPVEIVYLSVSNSIRNPL